MFLGVWWAGQEALAELDPAIRPCSSGGGGGTLPPDTAPLRVPTRPAVLPQRRPGLGRGGHLPKGGRKGGRKEENGQVSGGVEVLPLLFLGRCGVSGTSFMRSLVCLGNS